MFKIRTFKEITFLFFTNQCKQFTTVKKILRLSGGLRNKIVESNN